MAIPLRLPSPFRARHIIKRHVNRLAPTVICQFEDRRRIASHLPLPNHWHQVNVIWECGNALVKVTLSIPYILTNPRHSRRLRHAYFAPVPWRAAVSVPHFKSFRGLPAPNRLTGFGVPKFMFVGHFIRLIPTRGFIRDHWQGERSAHSTNQK